MCESCCLADSQGISLEKLGFQKLRFDMSPSNTSEEALYHMQSFRPLARRNPNKVFERSPEFLAYHAKTRIFSDFWLPNYAVWNLDPMTKSDKPLSPFSRHKSEPDNEIFQNLKSFLSEEFHNADYRHCIYLSILGHIGNREEEENDGVPESLRKTLGKLIGIYTNEILPLVDMKQTYVMIHPDHGTKRRNLPWEEAAHDGFLWIWQPGGRKIPPVPFTGTLPTATWKILLATLCDILNIDLPGRSSPSLLSYAR